MALLHIEGFDTFGQTIGIAPVGADRKHPTSVALNNTRVETGRTGDFSLKFNSTGSNFIFDDFGDKQTLFIGFGFKIDALVTNSFVFFQSGTSTNVRLELKSNGSLEMKGPTGATLGSTETGLIVVDTWFYIEMKVKVDDLVGEVELRVDKVVKFAVIDLDTQINSGQPHSNRVTVRGFSGANCFYDDFYILDPTGAKNNNFLNISIVTPMFPNAAGDFTDFTPDSGSNFARVNEKSTDDDTSHVESSTTGDKDLHNQDNVTPSGIIRGIQVNTEVRDTIGGGSSLKSLVKSGTTTDTGPADSIAGTSYEYDTRILEDDPDISGAWVTSALDAVQVGYEVG